MAIRHNYDYAVDSSKGNITYASVTILAQEFLWHPQCLLL